MDKYNFINRYILPFIMLFLIIIVWQSTNYLKTSRMALSNIMSNKLPIKENPVIIGGEIALSFYDNIADNEEYKLPENIQSKKGYKTTDIIGYSVNYPLSVINNKCWNLTIEFRESEYNMYTPNNFDLIKGSIYIDLNDMGNQGGSQPFYKDEKIVFDNDFKWDYFIEFDYLHKKGLMHSYSTKKIYDVDIFYLKKEHSIRLTLPIVEKINEKMDKDYMGRHIVLVGFYSPFNESGLLLKLRKDITPYYDMLYDKVKSDENNPEINSQDTGIFENNIDFVLKKLSGLKNNNYENKYTIDEILNDDMKQVKSLYDDDLYNDAENILWMYKDDSSIANTYLGIINAKKAGDNTISISKKMYLVNKAYKYFDKAENLLKNDIELYYLLKSRYQVSMSVPDDVFGKLDQAKDDLLRLIELNISKEEKSDYYCLLIDIYKRTSNKRELRLLIHELNHFLL